MYAQYQSVVPYLRITTRKRVSQWHLFFSIEKNIFIFKCSFKIKTNHFRDEFTQQIDKFCLSHY
jgi:hypothetical protein